MAREGIRRKSRVVQYYSRATGYWKKYNFTTERLTPKKSRGPYKGIQKVRYENMIALQSEDRR